MARFIRDSAGKKAYVRSGVVFPVQAEGNGEYEGSWHVGAEQGYELYVEIRTGRYYAVKGI